MTVRLADIVAHKLEDNFDTLVHRTIPGLLVNKLPAALKKFRTDSNETMYAVGYILLLFFIFVSVFFSTLGNN